MEIDKRDKQILRSLASRLADIASLPVQKEKAQMWERLNKLEPVKPMVWINEVPWHEMNVDEGLTLQCRDEFCRKVEQYLLETLYQWKHLRGDMVIEPKIYCPKVIRDTGFGIKEESDIVRIDSNNPIVSRHFHPQIEDEDDIEKIKDPEVIYDEETTELIYQSMCEIFDRILPVEKRGVPGFWFAPWDDLVTWWGVENLMMDLVERPDFVHKVIDRLVGAHLYRLDQYEKLGLLSLNNGPVRVGSGGYGYTDELPKPGYDPAHIRSIDLWGCATAQIFVAVSPQMHEEFAVKYEKRWLDRFGLSYYGCCEPLHRKMDMLRRNIPNLRKVSMNFRIDVDEAVEAVGRDYVFSYKPNPAILAEAVWDVDKARAELENVLKKTKAKGCMVEVIMKDISTVNYEPNRLWEWAEMASELTEEYS
ncbi:MAG TPA: hypothetical protein P5253_07180 [bacterium]|nr:hypothetical protein [bacterium]